MHVAQNTYFRIGVVVHAHTLRTLEELAAAAPKSCAVEDYLGELVDNLIHDRFEYADCVAVANRAADRDADLGLAKYLVRAGEVQ